MGFEEMWVSAAQFAQHGPSAAHAKRYEALFFRCTEERGRGQEERQNLNKKKNYTVLFIHTLYG
jgi:hypothetical protein